MNHTIAYIYNIYRISLHKIIKLNTGELEKIESSLLPSHMFKQMDKQTNPQTNAFKQSPRSNSIQKIIYFVPRNHTNDDVTFLKMAKPPRNNKYTTTTTKLNYYYYRTEAPKSESRKKC